MNTRPEFTQIAVGQVWEWHSTNHARYQIFLLTDVKKYPYVLGVMLSHDYDYYSTLVGQEIEFRMYHTNGNWTHLS